MCTVAYAENFRGGQSIGVARGAKVAMPPKMFSKSRHFVLWEAFFQTKKYYSPKIKHFGIYSRTLTVYIAKYCLYIFFIFRVWGGGVAQWPPLRTLVNVWEDPDNISLLRLRCQDHFLHLTFCTTLCCFFRFILNSIDFSQSEEFVDNCGRPVL